MPLHQYDGASPSFHSSSNQLLSMSSLSYEEADDSIHHHPMSVDGGEDVPSMNPTHLGLTPSASPMDNNNNGIISNTLLGGAAAAAVAYAVALHSGDGAVADQLSHLPNAVWQQYSQILASHPVWTKACTSGFVYTIGDVIAQRTEQSPSWDAARTARSMTAGFIGHGPLSHCWYNVCDGFFNDVLHWTAWWAVLPKIVVDQTVWGPIWNNLYILLLGVMKLEKPGVIVADMKRSTLPLIVSGLKLWPAAHLITYGLVPTENRLLWVDLVEILWVTILATQAASLAAQHDEKEQEALVSAASDATTSTTTAAN